jgi:hypothetical protein
MGMARQFIHRSRISGGILVAHLEGTFPDISPHVQQPLTTNMEVWKSTVVSTRMRGRCGVEHIDDDICQPGRFCDRDGWNDVHGQRDYRYLVR